MNAVMFFVLISQMWLIAGTALPHKQAYCVLHAAGWMIAGAIGFALEWARHP